jgi:hypothetical protein
MAESVIFVGWNRAIAGREKQSMQLFQKVMEYNSKLQAEGKIESFEGVMLSAHGGDLNGFVLYKGDARKLAAVLQEDTWVQLALEGQYCMQGFGVVSGYIGAGLTNVLSKWSKIIGS